MMRVCEGLNPDVSTFQGARPTGWWRRHPFSYYWAHWADDVDDVGQPGQDLITLITCTPYGVNSHRLLVHAERVPLDPEDGTAFDQKNRIVQWWMWVLLIVALLAIAYLIHWIRKERRKAAAAQCAFAEAS